MNFYESTLSNALGGLIAVIMLALITKASDGLAKRAERIQNESFDDMCKRLHRNPLFWLNIRFRVWVLQPIRSLFKRDGST